MGSDEKDWMGSVVGALDEWGLSLSSLSVLTCNVSSLGRHQTRTHFDRANWFMNGGGAGCLRMSCGRTLPL